MADKKTSTLILTVDLKCRRCYKKIRKVIAEFPEIQGQIFNEKNNEVSISGPFDPEKLKRKLCCKACKYIIGIKIKPPPSVTPPSEPVLPVPGIPVGPYAPMVCCRPCCEGYPEHGICTRFGYERGTCKCNYKFIIEEDPSCSIM